MNNIERLKIFKRQDVIEWRSQSHGTLPTATRIQLKRLSTDLFSFNAHCYFGYLQKGDLPKEVFEFLNKDLDKFPLLPLILKIDDTDGNELWVCRISYESTADFVNPDWVGRIFKQINLVAEEAAFNLIEKCPMFHKISNEILCSEIRNP